MAEPSPVSGLLPSQQNLNAGCCGSSLDKTTVIKIILVVLGILALAGAITLGGWGQKLLPHIFTTTQQQIIVGSVLGTIGLSFGLGVFAWQIRDVKASMDATRDLYKKVQASNRSWHAVPHPGVESKNVVFNNLQACSFLFYGINAELIAARISGCISEKGEEWIDSTVSLLSNMQYKAALFFYPKIEEDGSVSNHLLIFQMTISKQKEQKFTLELDKSDSPLYTPHSKPIRVKLAEGVLVIDIMQDFVNKITLAIVPNMGSIA